MNEEEMQQFVAERIEILRNDQESPAHNSNGIFLHFIPQNLLEGNNFDWTNKDDKFKIQYAFRRFSDFETVYNDLGDKLIADAERERYSCFQNGIIEVFKGPIDNRTPFQREVGTIEVGGLLYTIRDFLNSSRNIHTALYNSAPPYNICISLLGIHQKYLVSFEKNYISIEPFPEENFKFEAIVLNDLDSNPMNVIINNLQNSINNIGIRKLD